MPDSGILKESFQMLKNSPEMFLPKIISSILGSLWFVGFLAEIGPIYLYALTAPIIGFLGFFVTVMLASMVKNRGKSNKIKASLYETASIWKEISLSIIGILVLMLLVQIPAILGITYFIINGSFLILIFSVLVSVVLFFGVVFLGFFFPISLIDQRGISQSLKDSANLSLSNKKEVTGITILAFILLGLAGLANSTLGQALGFAGFIVFRLISAVISTYIYVVSPTYYLEASS